MIAAKKVLRYLKGTAELGLEFGNSAIGITEAANGVKGYTDSNYAGDISNRKSTMGYVFFVSQGLVAWSSKKQRTVSTSISEAEYIALGFGARQAVWIRRFINEIGYSVADGPSELLGDNEASIKLARNAEQHNRTKHIDVQHHYTRHLIEDGELTVAWVPTTDMLADGMTKALPKGPFLEHRERLGMIKVHPTQKDAKNQGEPLGEAISETR